MIAMRQRNERRRRRAAKDRGDPGRERTFRCPNGACTKRYLNPNGLKYHVEKGTCTGAGAGARPWAGADAGVAVWV